MKTTRCRALGGLALLLCFSGMSYAQNCANGIPQGGNPSCIPPDVPGSPYYRGDDDSPSEPAPVGRWISTWGAIASDVERARVGATIGKFSERQAKAFAKQYCENQGGVNCRILMSFENQCGALVWPMQGGRVATSGGASADAASQAAMDVCQEVGGKGCEVFYSECSRPIFQRY